MSNDEPGDATGRVDRSPFEISADVFFDHAGVMMIAIAPDERITLINRKACEVLGCDTESIIGSNWFDKFIPESMRATVREVFKRVIAGEVNPVEHFENPVLTRSGQERLIAWHNTVIRDDSGRILCSLSSGEDVTELREGKRQLSESRERFRSLFERANDGMLVADAHTRRFIAANPAICEMLGYERDEVLSLQIDDIHPSNAIPRVESAFEQQLLGELDVAVDLPALRKDGTILSVDISSAPVTIDGRPCMLGIFRNMTEKRQMETNLLQTQKLESLGVLAGGLAHDLNNILVGILGHADLARQVRSEPRVLTTHLDALVNSATQAASLCQQLLEYAGKAKSHLEPVDINRLAAEATALLDVTISKNARLKISVPDSPLMVAGVAAQLRQVLVNLVTNASEAMGDGGGSIELRTSAAEVKPELSGPWLHGAQPVGGECVLIEVSDDGCGMDAATRARVFDPFFTTKSDGRGLGLSAVVGIIKQHRGALTIDSTPDRGTCVQILLPLADATVIERPPQPPAETVDGDSRLVLVADDDPTVRMVAQLMLEKAGFRVATASDCPSAVAACTELGSQPSAAIFDLTMPHGGGVDAAKRVRELIPNLPVLFMSGYSDASMEEVDSQIDNSAFLQKPFVAEQLLGALSALLPPRYR